MKFIIGAPCLLVVQVYPQKDCQGLFMHCLPKNKNVYKRNWMQRLCTVYIVRLLCWILLHCTRGLVSMKIEPLHIYLIYHTKERIGHTKCVRLLLHSAKKQLCFLYLKKYYVTDWKSYNKRCFRMSVFILLHHNFMLLCFSSLLYKRSKHNIIYIT